MNIDIIASEIDLTDPLREYINEKVGSLDKFLVRYGEVHAQVEVARATKHHKHGDVYYAEVNLSFPGGSLRATDTSEDIRTSIDKVRDILQREIGERKDKHS